MKVLIATSMAALLLFSGCAVSLRGHGHGYHYRHHGHRHHRHHRHHHWNAPGPAYLEAAQISEITILPVTLPKDIDGEVSSSAESELRSSLPDRAASLIADGLTKSTDSAVRGTTSKDKPSSGYYMTIEINYLDIGDPTPNADGTPKQRGSSLFAHGAIINAATGQLVADVKFSESSGWTGTSMVEPFMTRIGSSLGNWLKERRD